MPELLSARETLEPKLSHANRTLTDASHRPSAGRLLDFMEEGAIDCSGVSYLVLDEADRMLDLGSRTPPFVCFFVGLFVCFFVGLLGWVVDELAGWLAGWLVRWMVG